MPLPFAVGCKSFTLKTYPGSESPSSFESEIRIIDKKNNYTSDRKVFMNTAITNYFNSSYKNLVSYFAEEEKISAEELREILALIEKKK